MLDNELNIIQTIKIPQNRIFDRVYHFHLARDLKDILGENLADYVPKISQDIDWKTNWIMICNGSEPEKILQKYGEKIKHYKRLKQTFENFSWF